MKNLYSIFIVVATLVCGCQTDTTTNIENQSGATIILLLDNSHNTVRTSLGEKIGETYPVYWSEGDRIAVNGIESADAQISSENSTSATFTIDGEVGSTYNITYPYTPTTTADSPRVVFPAEQSYVEGTFGKGYAPMCGYGTKGSTITLMHLASAMRLPVKATVEGATLSKIVITSTSKIAGEFSVDCHSTILKTTEKSTNTITYTVNKPLSTTDATVCYITLPMGDRGSCTVEFIDSEGGTMSASWSAKNLKRGIVYEFKDIKYKAGATLTLPGYYSDYDLFEGSSTYSGIVTDTNGNPIEGVVISDGEKCVKTDEHGFYQMDGNIADAKFVMASIPSGYKALNDANGIPQFFHRITTKEKLYEYCVADFVFEPISGDPNRYTLLVGADPQPRAKSAGYDKIAYHSLDICEDFYRDLRETRATITGHEVYGMMLGDLVHEQMSLYSKYVAGLKSLNLQMFNIIGNHDHDLSATTDEEGARCFEENFGPTYYSFNIGKQHYVILDDIIMTVVNGKLKKNEYSYGLTDRQWQWLQNDLQHVDKSTTLMVAAHAPMFYGHSGTTIYASSSVAHGMDYANLFAMFDKVHAWAGHTHVTFNYNHPSSALCKNVEVHTVARSTGHLWLNEYTAYGTPRGYTIVEVDGENIEWRFKATAYQADFCGDNFSYTTGMPAYALRDWDYVDGVAYMKETNKKLDGSYQMKVYKPEDYGDGYVYANIFLWDNKWETPKFNGVEMVRISPASARELAYHEVYYFYKQNCSQFTSNNDLALKSNCLHTLFRTASKPASSGEGTVTVTDRFGNNYSSTVSW